MSQKTSGGKGSGGSGGRAGHLPRLARAHAAGRRIAWSPRALPARRGRGVGGLLHLKFMGGTGRPSDVTDNTLSSVLAVLDRFKRGVLGNSIASATRSRPASSRTRCLRPTASRSASLVDLIQADLADGKIYCGHRPCAEPRSLRVCFQPFEGRVWVCGPSSLPARARRAPLLEVDAARAARFVVSSREFQQTVRNARA